ncbi:MAG: hypothetical protein WDN48_07410 [Pseudolabrys sp.]
MPRCQPDASVEPTGSVASALAVEPTVKPALYGSDPNDDLNLGKKQYRANNFGLAGEVFPPRRRAASTRRRSLARAGCVLRPAAPLRSRRPRPTVRPSASSGRRRRFSTTRAIPTCCAVDYTRARAKLIDAQRKDPRNKYVANNLALLEESVRKGKAIE